MDTITYHPIGIIHTPFAAPADVPRPPVRGKGYAGTITIDDKYATGLKDVEGFSHLVVVFHMHLVKGYEMLAHPPMDDSARGLFATRSPHRPNPIGISIVKLVRIEGNKLFIEDVDMVDGTPVLDIKPYIPADDERMGNIRIGWLEKLHQ